MATSEDRIPQYCKLQKHVGTILFFLFKPLADDRPHLQYLNKHVREQVGAKSAHTWKDLGMELLGVGSNDALEVIKNSNSDVTDCCSAMFKLWLDRDPKASWEKLLQALKEIQLNFLATQIESKLQTAVLEPSSGLLPIDHVPPKVWSLLCHTLHTCNKLLFYGKCKSILENMLKLAAHRNQPIKSIFSSRKWNKST